MDIKCYKAKLIRVQRLINIRIAKAYRTVSNEALCVITGLIPINIKIQETAKYCECIKGQGILLDREMEVKHWTHPANTVEINDNPEDRTHNIHVYTDGSKSEQGVGSGIAIFIDSKVADTKQYRLNGRCSNNQAKQMAILKALENIEYFKTNDRRVLISIDSQISLESLKNRKNHTYLIETVRKKVTEMQKQNWTIDFTWIKARAGHHGNELADKYAKEAATNSDTAKCYKRIPKSAVKRELSD
jgi:ribonuclease HI